MLHGLNIYHVNLQLGDILIDLEGNCKISSLTRAERAKFEVNPYRYDLPQLELEQEQLAQEHNNMLKQASQAFARVCFDLKMDEVSFFP